MNVVWFKRDLRIHDNLALKVASQKGNTIPLYILEPELWCQPDMSFRHYKFLCESIEDLNSTLKELGQELIIRVGNVVDILNEINEKYNIEAVYSHQETWNDWTYKRDLKVKKFLKEKNIIWHEYKQNGVTRCLKTRDGWSYSWYQHMNKRLVDSVENLINLSKFNIKNEVLLEPIDLGLKDDGCILRQKGGRFEALRLLDSFFYERGEHYTKEMSSPVTAFESCSRISPHLAFGNLSIREIYQLTQKRKKDLQLLPEEERGKWLSAMRSFSARLRWHCHFIQKLEDEPQIEFENMHSAYDGIREPYFSQEFFEAWKQGKTGYPMIDACMRCLIATGWINFRMRAMLMSFASYHLFLHWRETSVYLATLFTDYEPGIHYSQAQMQSGTTGINSVRIYNPIKQSIEQDPNGQFIRNWVPELENVDDEYIHQPWELDKPVKDYPAPIVDEVIARRFAADKIYSVRKQPSHKVESQVVVKKHASRKKTISTRKAKSTKNKKNDSNQLDLFD